MNKVNILKAIEECKVEFLYLIFTDITGMSKKVTIPARNTESAIEEGVWFDGSSIEGFARICESDMLLKPDIETFAILPWTIDNCRSAQMICDVYMTNDQPFPGDPRGVLKRMLRKSEDMGFRYKAGPEIEFFLIDRNDLPDIKPHDRKGYFDLGVQSRAVMICQNAMRDMDKLGYSCESYHHEVSEGQHETDLHYDDALRIADGVITLKHALRTHSRQNGFKVTFMPKPITGINGSGMHVHQSLADGSGTNLFYDSNDDYNLSDIAYQFLAGQIHHAKAMAAIVAPTINSYKRLVPGFEAPVYICWGRVNRSALIRIPSVSSSKVKEGTRLELRNPDPSCNPYLAFAAMLGAGLDGIEKKMKPPEPVEENVYGFSDEMLLKKNISTLPKTINEAICNLEENTILRELIGYGLTEHFIQAKRREWYDFMSDVTSWELKRYL